MVLFPAVVEALESFGGEADRCCGCKVEAARVEEIEESVLEDLLCVRRNYLEGFGRYTSVHTLRCSNLDSASPPITAFAMLPIPDWIGRRFLGRRSCFTSCSRNSIR